MARRRRKRADHGSRCRSLSNRTVERLKPQSKQAKAREIEYRDTEVIGLSLRINRKGRKIWQFRYHYRKKKRGLTIGEWPGIDSEEARDIATEWRALVDKGIDPAEYKRELEEEPEPEMTFRDFSEEMYLPYAKSSKKSWDQDENKLHSDWYPAVGDIPMPEIGTADLQRRIMVIRERASAVTANRHRSLIKRMFTLAVKWDVIETSPADKIERFREPPPRERFLSEEEIDAFLAALDRRRYRVPADAIRTLLFTGLRKSELLTATAEQYDPEERTLLLENTKNGRRRRVPINEAAAEILDKRLAECTKRRPWLFPNRKKRGPLKDVRKTFDESCREAGLEREGPNRMVLHSLRHSFASYLAAKGVALHTIGGLLGHTQIATTMRYAHWQDEALREASKKVAERVKKP